MSFVPFTPPPTTRRSRELAKEIVKTVEAYREREPRMRDTEVARALQLARSRLTGMDRTILMVVVGLVVFLLALGLFVAGGGGR